MKIRIFALAKELGLDSKDLIDHCSDAGISVKNSALASISPEERDVLMAHMKGVQSSGTATATVDEPPPSRELPRDQGRMRVIERPRPVSQPELEEEPPLEVETVEPTEAEVTPEEPVVAEVEANVTESVPESESKPVAEVAPETEDASPAAESVPEAPAETEAAAESEAKPEAENDVSADAEAEKKPEAPAKPALKRDDFVGARPGRRQVVDMRPRGTQDREIRDREKERERRAATDDKPKPRPNVMGLAAPPSYTPPKVAKPQKPTERAQKPDVPLTPDILREESPLKAHLKKHKADQDTGSGGGNRRRSLQEEAKNEGNALNKKTRRSRSRTPGEEDDRRPTRRRSHGRRNKRTGPIEYTDSAIVEFPLTVRSLSEAMGRPAKQLMGVLFREGTMVRINDELSEEQALEIAMDLGVEIEFKRGRDIEEELRERIETPDLEESLVERPPIVTILGHVDHGKTSLLDRIRSANVASGEAGGITQHIAAYQVEHEGKPVSFVDTPGHAAFGEMRARGATVTDIIVLVIAADDGVMPQTVECISHAKAAGVPIMVAMNKVDLPDFDPQKVFNGLAQHELLPIEWGGEVEVVKTSAMTGEGIDDLLETILVTAEVNEFKANPERQAFGVCLEAFRDEGRGVIAWLIVQNGTLRIGDVILCGQSYGRIRAMYNDRDEPITEAPPSTPVRIAGLDEVPGAGDRFFVLEDIDEARETAETRRFEGRTGDLNQRSSVRPQTIEDVLKLARGGEVQDLPLIIKADTPGSIEAIKGELGKLEHDEVRIKIIHDAVGGVNESDVSLAVSTGAYIVAFHVIAEDRAEQLADAEGVQIRRFDIIYELTDTIKRELEGLLIPERVKVPTGRALVLRTFDISRIGRIAGCRVLNGTIERNHKIQVSRDRTVLNDYDISSLKREKDDVKEVREGMECGILLKGFNDVKEGDLFDAYMIEERQRTLD